MTAFAAPLAPVSRYIGAIFAKRSDFGAENPHFGGVLAQITVKSIAILPQSNDGEH